MSEEQGEKADEGDVPPPAGNTKKPAPPGRAKRIANKIVKYSLVATLISSPFRGTWPNMAVRGLQTTGLLPKLGDLKSQETEAEEYLNVVGPGFVDGIDAAPLPAIPLKPARVENYVIEPSGKDLPSYFFHSEGPLGALSIKRMNTTVLHDRNVASSYYHGLKKTLGRDPEVKLIDGLACEGLIFNGPHVALFKNSKTIINKSVGAAAFEPTRDTHDDKAWTFFAAGNLGSGGADDFHAQLSGVGNHGPRNVMVGSAHSSSTHCGPVFYTDASTSGTIKGEEARFGFLPSDVSEGTNGYDTVTEGWGGTSMSSPTAAGAKFSPLMERYGNYLSEEQIFTALCYATAKTTKESLSPKLKDVAAPFQLGVPDVLPKLGVPNLPFKLGGVDGPLFVTQTTETYGMYDATNTPARPTERQHFYDPAMHGFGKVTSEAVSEADRICQDMVIYTAYRPQAVCQPTTIKAHLRLSEQATRDEKGRYVYKVQLPHRVNLNNVVLQGTVNTKNLNKEKISVVAGGIKIRVPVGNLDPLKEQEWVSNGEESSFIGSTRGFTGAGPVDEVEIRSTVPLQKDFSLTLYNTLAEKDVVSTLPWLHASVDMLQLRDKERIRWSLSNVKPIDTSKVEPNPIHVRVGIYPANVPRDEVIQDQQHEQAQIKPLQNDENRPDRLPKEVAYWRKRETDPPPTETYIGKT